MTDIDDKRNSVTIEDRARALEIARKAMSIKDLQCQLDGARIVALLEIGDQIVAVSDEVSEVIREIGTLGAVLA